MDLVQVDGVHAEPLQAGLAFVPDRVGLEAVVDLAVPVPDHAALGEDVRPVAHPFEGAGDDLFRVSEAVDGRGVDPVNSGVQSFVDDGDGVAVVLAAPGELPA